MALDVLTKKNLLEEKTWGIPAGLVELALPPGVAKELLSHIMLLMNVQ